MDRNTVVSFMEHLQDLLLQLVTYQEIDTSFEWIRNPFQDKMHIEHVSSKL